MRSKKLEQQALKLEGVEWNEKIQRDDEEDEDLEEKYAQFSRNKYFANKK